jgi:tryptophan synthase alpha chain
MTGEQRINAAFSATRADNRAAFMPYLTAGFPDAESFVRDALLLLEHADLLEIGLPFSDPLGDGPTVQMSSQEALRQGATTAGTFALISELRKQTDKPLVLMSYYNPIYCHPGGETQFVRDLVTAGGDGIILPDLPPEEAGGLKGTARELGLATVFLVAPTSTRKRLQRVTRDCRGFVYAVSVTGVTGARATASSEVPLLLERLREVTDLPVAVGFGVSGAATASAVAAVADGVVVGSALIALQAGGGDLAGLAAEIVAAGRR